MIDVVFKKNYFEELPDDIKDKILKKAKEMKLWDKINKGNLDIYRRLKKAKKTENVYVNLYEVFLYRMSIITDNNYHSKKGEVKGDIFYYPNLKILCDIVKKIIILYNYDKELAEKVLKKYLGGGEYGTESFLKDCLNLLLNITGEYNSSHIKYLHRDLLQINERYDNLMSSTYYKSVYIKAFLESELKTLYLIKELYDYFEYCNNKGFVIKEEDEEESIDWYLFHIRSDIRMFEFLIDIKNKKDKNVLNKN